jgi:hypothetical protein
VHRFRVVAKKFPARSGFPPHDGGALDLQVEPGKAPIKVNSGTKVTNLNADKVDGKDSTAFLPSNGTAVDADKVDGKHADELSRVAVMNTGDTTPLPTDGSQVTYGQQLTIMAPTAGSVRVNGNVAVLNGGCSSGCQFTAYVRHINSGALSIPQQEEATNTYGNAGLDAVFPVDAGANTFDIRVARSGTSGTLYGWWGVLTAEYTPYGSTGTSTLDATGVSTTSQTPKHKTLPER